MKYLAKTAVLIATFSVGLFGQALDKEKTIAAVDRVFERTSKAAGSSSPGCAIGVALNSETIFQKAFGLAEIEHNVPNTVDTIFESGSVGKQFTAASIVLLSLEGKLKLDDPVRNYIPEMPDYGSPLTIRNLLNHTAGLRDWGSVMQLTGAGRGDRVISQELAMQVILDQRGLDFKPGDEYSYSNSGYTLLSTIVERVSKQKLPAFTAERFFKPLGMTHSSWRDDYRRLVPGRAQGYSKDGSGKWQLDMPFMNVYGNGGMLTTIGDWLKWNAMLDSRSLGAPLVEALETTGVLNDGRKITYALGLTVSKYKGQTEISHNGSTAGYQTYLGRFPDNKLSVAIVCNGVVPNSTNLAHSIVDEIVGPASDSKPVEKTASDAADLQPYVGMWRNIRTHFPIRTVIENGELKLAGQPALKRQPDGSFIGSGSRFTFKTDAAGKAASFHVLAGDVVLDYAAEPEWKPTAAELAQFTGNWYADEAGALFSLKLEGDKLYFTQRPDTKILLKPEYKDGFTLEGGGIVLWATRDKAGKIEKLHISLSRLRDMPFERMAK